MKWHYSYSLGWGIDFNELIPLSTNGLQLSVKSGAVYPWLNFLHANSFQIFNNRLIILKSTFTHIHTNTYSRICICITSSHEYLVVATN